MKTYIFDLDGTLAVSKGPIDQQMKSMLYSLLRKRRVCVVSGGQWKQFKEQLIDHLDDQDYLSRLICFPTSGATCYRLNRPEGWIPGDPNEWEQVYDHCFNAYERLKIKASLIKASQTMACQNRTIWGETIEDRGSQITFSALGQQAPIEEKEKWDPDKKIRRRMVELMKSMNMDDFEIRIGGTTSIDITKKGIHKGFAINKIMEMFNLRKDNLIFFGDSLEPGGNDHEVYKAGVLCIPVDDHIDCVWKIRSLLDAGQ